ncbi:tRNA guanosine(34) transglycosylase Tgt [Campylobacter canadensis]|nr:tRNA guanosine(34) transglycosylase Tgt [Campylobacter canadensis]MBZ7994104.1 tRNA guanosine(34) transglycosylase Tgt [Campylobacter canadensis]MBZ7995893.1 tRNA guanosine(34) transglycosylase Tgt [Campylobacter canadensis]MBZ7999435.1 tRNA guanosine(34) transglycosylase Tgt [Campylobacter canadensis]MBZ8001232.1 tRNA guanosine(34) transglycosylase Tgt [Campylobacter canadensis]MBZ8003761.1 tRNA guanosine(34) transglycosylase Tgt [Campylobacter canadensis]
MEFKLQFTDENARCAQITTAHSTFSTPCFMPVGTQACVKALDAIDMKESLGAKIILANTYHTYLRPGANLIAEFGGLHNYTKYDLSFLTDSGGFQAFSLNSNTKHEEDGIIFKSHIDGSKHKFTPFSVLKTQYLLNSDICMVLDDLCALPASEERIKASLKRTILWAKESLKMKDEFLNIDEDALLKKYSYELYKSDFKQKIKAQKREQNIFAIVQGATDKNYRKECLEGILSCENKHKFDGLAIGGLSVGEENILMYETLENLCPLMPKDRPRYLMGVGTPLDLVVGVKNGVDMFDCVMPTRNARNATLFTSFGKLNIKAASMKDDENAIDNNCSCYTCKNYSRAYLHHLFKAKEITFFRLASLHNLHYYLTLMKDIQEAIKQKRFKEFYNEFIKIYKLI